MWRDFKVKCSFCACCASLFFGLSTEILNKCKGDLLQMNDSKLKTQPSLLENLIFFVEVRPLCFHTWSHDFTLTLGHMCRNILVLFRADGVHSLVDGRSLCQDPPTTQDESTEEKEEEEKGRKRSCGTVRILLLSSYGNASLYSSPPELISTLLSW